jgi:hypothetical protein
MTPPLSFLVSNYSPHSILGSISAPFFAEHRLEEKWNSINTGYPLLPEDVVPCRKRTTQKLCTKALKKGISALEAAACSTHLGAQIRRTGNNLNQKVISSSLTANCQLTPV